MTECGKAADLEPVRVEAEKLIVECAGDVEPQRAKRVGRYARFVEREQFRRDGGAAQKVGGSEAAPDDAVPRLADERDTNGNASGRERVCQYVESSVVAADVKKK